ncbi:MAG: radical SAM protein [Gemmataceae bacterium]|nr:radical SAM protein [Gemmataceae bacterium]
MPHVTYVPLTGARVREEAMRELGMTLPGLQARAGAVGQLPALGLLTLAGLQPPHWTCSYRETPTYDHEAIQAICNDRPDLVAVSALTASVEEAYRLSHRLRSAGLRTVLGGLHATACTAEATAHFNAVVAGEGEPVWPTVLADAEANNLQPIYRERRPFALVRAPVPRFDLLGVAPRPRFTLQTQRGCPLACDFCGASRLLGGFREKPAANLVQELGDVTRIAPRPLLEFADDNTFAGKRDLTPFLDALAECGARWFTETDWRLGEDGARLRGIAAAGCVQVLVGLESLDQRHAGMGSKQADWPRTLDAIHAIQEAGIAVIGCFIAGCDGETLASLDRTAGFILASPLADVQITLQTPFPGTALHERLRRQHRLLPTRGWSHYTLFDVTYQPAPLSVVELEKGFRELVGAVFATEPTRRRQRLRRNIWANNPRLRPWAS